MVMWVELGSLILLAITQGGDESGRSLTWIQPWCRQWVGEDLCS